MSSNPIVTPDLSKGPRSPQSPSASLASSPFSHKKTGSISETLSPNTAFLSSDIHSQPSVSSIHRRLSNASAMSLDDSSHAASPPGSSVLNLPPKTPSAPGTASSISTSASSPFSPISTSTSGASPSPGNNATGALASPTHSPSNSVSAAPIGGRNWREVQMNELVQRENLVYVDGDTTVEKAFEILNKHKFTSLPIKLNPEDPSVSNTFDYADLNAYLLMVMGLIEPINIDEEIDDYVTKARSGEDVPVKFAARLGAKNTLISLNSTSTILEAVEILGGGVHRVAITDSQDTKIIIGILSQRRLIRFIWEHGRQFKSLEPFFQTKLVDLGIGPKQVVSINGDRPVIDALKIMHQDGVSSLAVTDSSNNLLGNISIVDVRLVTKSTQKHLLRAPCKQFLSIILNERGLHDGQDSYPVFHVTLSSTIGRTIAKLVATKAHRLWIVQPPQQKADTSTASTSTVLSAVGGGGGLTTTSGQLIGVISLTDILNMLAKKAGKADLDPHSARRQRRRSSSSSTRSTVSSFRRSISTDRSQR